jgi:HD-GYP domain-containing protein (c-di-GMP phosphodiesterase class II)
MREHVTRGAEILSRFPPLLAAVPAVLHHHERWDGRGYPDGLSGEDIPLPAAIIALADGWDTMTSNRGYAAALSLGDALAEVRAVRGVQFSPRAVDALFEAAKHRPADILPSDAPDHPSAAI